MPSDDWHIRSIFHFTVNATNFERSLDFYTTIGFKVLRDNRDVIWPRMVARNFGMPAAQGRGALLGIGDGELHTRLDLIEWLEPALDPPPDGPIELRVPRIIALRTDNVQAAYDDLSARGIEFVSQPAVVEARRHRERVRVPRSRRPASSSSSSTSRACSAAASTRPGGATS